MNIAHIREALLWCVILNIGLVTVWSILVLVAKGCLNGIILKWFRVSAEHCDMINLTGIVLYKVTNLLFFIVPYIALRIVKRPVLGEFRATVCNQPNSAASLSFSADNH